MVGLSSYIICTAPRSGSTLLCSLLKATRVAGAPASYFYGSSVDEWLGDLDIASDPNWSLREQLRAVFDKAAEMGRRGGDIFGLRQQAHGLKFFFSQLALYEPNARTDRERFETVFGRTQFIYLHRDDKLAQAVSYLKAVQTGLWHAAPDGSELERLHAHQEPVYDAAQLRDCAERFAGYDQLWERWFAEEAVEPVRITYDELSAAPRACLRRVLETLGLDSDLAASVPVPVRKLADSTNAEWMERYRAATRQA